MGRATRRSRRYSHVQVHASPPCRLGGVPRREGAAVSEMRGDACCPRVPAPAAWRVVLGHKAVSLPGWALISWRVELKGRHLVRHLLRLYTVFEGWYLPRQCSAFLCSGVRAIRRSLLSLVPRALRDFRPSPKEDGPGSVTPSASTPLACRVADGRNSTYASVALRCCHLVAMPVPTVSRRLPRLGTVLEAGFTRVYPHGSEPAVGSLTKGSTRSSPETQYCELLCG